jgi:hypothetical protein
MTEPEGDKRSAPRVSYPCEVDCLGPEDTTLHLRIADVSLTGAFVDAMTTLPAGTFVNMRFTIEGQVLTIGAEVCHAMPGIGMGVRFAELTEPQASLLNRLVAERS